MPRSDPDIAVPFKAITPEMAAAGEAVLWQTYDAVRCPTLLIRGAESDLLSRDTAGEMTQRGPRARLVEFARRRPCADAGAARAGDGGARVPAVAMKTR